MNDYKPTDFDIEDDYKEDPLIPRGTYHGSVTNVKIDLDKCYIMWEVTFNENGTLMSDDETPVDGAKLNFFNYLPKEGDKNEMTKSGKQTKHQSKVNMLRQFADGMGITQQFKNIQTIIETIDNQELIGLDVDAAVIIDTYEGRVSSKIDKLFLQK